MRCRDSIAAACAGGQTSRPGSCARDAARPLARFARFACACGAYGAGRQGGREKAGGRGGTDGGARGRRPYPGGLTAKAASSNVSHASSHPSSSASASAGMSTMLSTVHTMPSANSNAELEQAVQDMMQRAEAAEDRLLRSMARFSKITPLADKIAAHRGGSATIACVDSKNEMNEPALWESFLTASPVQYLKAELKTPTQTAILERNLGKFEVGVPLIAGSLNMKLMPDLTISKVQRDDLDCQEGDRIVEVEGIPVTSIEELRVHLQGRTEITLVIENGGTPLFTIHDASTPYWEVTTIPTATSVRGSLQPGDLVLRINDVPVAGVYLSALRLHIHVQTYDTSVLCSTRIMMMIDLSILTVITS